MTKKVSVLIGSLRAGSYARKIAHVAMEFFPADYDVQIVEIGNLPLYNFDCDDPNVPEVSVPANGPHSVKQSKIPMGSCL